MVCIMPKHGQRGAPYFVVHTYVNNKTVNWTNHKKLAVALKKARAVATASGRKVCVVKAVPVYNGEHGWEDSNKQVRCYGPRR